MYVGINVSENETKQMWNGINVYVCRHFCMKLALKSQGIHIKLQFLKYIIILCKGIIIAQMLVLLYIDSITPVYHRHYSISPTSLLGVPFLILRSSGYLC